jgi:hypothetical protein
MPLRTASILLLAPALLFFPFLWLPAATFFGGTDVIFYTDLLSLVTDQLRAGVWYPRWLADANLGLGSPALYFYSPLPYTLTALLTLPFPLAPAARLLTGMYLAQGAAGFAAFYWLKRHFAPRVALVCALAYVLLPYKLAILFLHGNLAQLWALAALPLWMRAAENLAREKTLRAMAAYAAWLALVYYLHALTVLAFAWVPLLYVARSRVFLPLAAAHLLALGITAPHWLVMLEARPMIFSDLLTGGKFDVLENLRHRDVFLTTFLALLAAPAALLMLRNKENTADMRFWLLALAVFFFLCTPLSAPLWRALPPLRLLQFPVARLYPVGLFAAVYALGFALSRRPREWMFHPGVPLGVAAFYTVLMLQHIHALYRPAQSLTDTYVARMQQARMLPLEVYTPRWSPLTPAAILAQQQELLALPAPRPGDTLDVQPGPLTLRPYYLPLWQAAPLVPRADGRGLLALDIPPGTHHIMLTLRPLPSEHTAFVLMLAACGLTALLYGYGKKPHGRP